MDELKLPSDLDIRLWVIMQEDLVKKYDSMNAMLRLHEYELMLMWGLMVTTLIGVGYIALQVHQLKELK